MISSTSQLADVVNANPATLSVLERLNIHLGFHEATIEEVCKRYGLSPQLLTNIFNIYAGGGYEPRANELTKDDILKLVKYLKTSHKYYSGKSFPSLHNKIHLLLEEGDQNNAMILNKFYDDYTEELDHHFLFEEKIVFPFLEEQLQSEDQRPATFDINLFEENHTNIEEKLSDLKNTILKYLPDCYSQTLRTEILKDIYSIAEDLQKHTEIEDRLLVPAIIRFSGETISKSAEDSPLRASGKGESFLSDDNGRNTLSQREKDIVIEVAKGLTNKEIADRLHLSVHTVTTHRKNISRKTGINSISGLTVYAIINKLVNLNEL